jgi:hypothetical protein
MEEFDQNGCFLGAGCAMYSLILLATVAFWGLLAYGVYTAIIYLQTH